MSDSDKPTTCGGLVAFDGTCLKCGKRWTPETITCQAPVATQDELRSVPNICQHDLGIGSGQVCPNCGMDEAKRIVELGVELTQARFERNEAHQSRQIEYKKRYAAEAEVERLSKNGVKEFESHQKTIGRCDDLRAELLKHADKITELKAELGNVKGLLGARDKLIPKLGQQIKDLHVLKCDIGNALGGDDERLFVVRVRELKAENDRMRRRHTIPCPDGMDEHRKADYHQGDENCPAGVRQLVAKAAEVERLTNGYAQCRRELSGALSKGRTAEAEAERLRGEWEAARADVATVVAERDKFEQELRELIPIKADLAAMTADRDAWQGEHNTDCPNTIEVERLREMGTEIDRIRNSIVQLQSIHWSNHIYPLVAALEKAGYEGENYDDTRAKAQAEIDRWTKQLESAEIERLRAALEQVRCERDFRVRCNEYIQGVVDAALHSDDPVDAKGAEYCGLRGCTTKPGDPCDVEHCPRNPKNAEEAEAEPLEEGDDCGEKCGGKMGFAPVDNCSCHISPPCHRCVENPLVCLGCGFEPEEASDV